jgi:microcystin-dependent protein
MSNYTIAVNWAGKNALSDSDAAKIISGTDFNTEFTTVQTAVNSKANLNGSATESFSTSTAVASSNTTLTASTAYVTSAIATATPTQAEVNAHAYPVGSVYTAIVSTNPATLLGVGTWSAFGAGKVLIGIDSGDTDFDTVEETGGAKTDSHTLTTAEMPAHTHNLTQLDYAPGGGGTFDSQTLLSGATNSYNSNAGSITGDIGDTDSTGGGGAHTHDIVQPYIVVYFWKRTA